MKLAKFFKVIGIVFLILFVLLISTYIRHKYVKVFIYNDFNLSTKVTVYPSSPKYFTGRSKDELEIFDLEAGERLEFYYSQNDFQGEMGLYVCTDDLLCSYSSVSCRGFGGCSTSDLNLGYMVSRFKPYNLKSGKIDR